VRDLEKNLGEDHPAVKELKLELETRVAAKAKQIPLIKQLEFAEEKCRVASKKVSQQTELRESYLRKVAEIDKEAPALVTAQREAETQRDIIKCAYNKSQSSVDPETAHADVEKLRTVMSAALQSAVKGTLHDPGAVETQFNSLLANIGGALPPVCPGVEAAVGALTEGVSALGVGSAPDAGVAAAPPAKPAGGAAMDEDGDDKAPLN